MILMTATLNTMRLAESLTGLTQNKILKIAATISNTTIVIIFRSLIIEFQLWVLKVQEKFFILAGFCLFLNFFCLFINFSKKLLVLLFLERIYLICVFLLFTFCLWFNYNYFSIFLFSIFMVLDRVLGISLLVRSSRNSSTYCPVSVSYF